MHRVRWIELDSLGHMNNAAYLDMLVQGALDVLDESRMADRPPGRRPTARRGWRTATSSISTRSAPVTRLETATWFGAKLDATGDGLEVHQTAARVADGRPVARATMTWRWAHLHTDAPAPLPDGLVAAVETTGEGSWTSDR